MCAFKLLSIPLNGFSSFKGVVASRPWPTLSIPSNGFPVAAYLLDRELGAPFNSIEWIQVKPVKEGVIRRIVVLSIPLNGFMISNLMQFGLFEVELLSIPLNGFRS